MENKQFKSVQHNVVESAYGYTFVIVQTKGYTKYFNSHVYFYWIENLKITVVITYTRRGTIKNKYRRI